MKNNKLTNLEFGAMSFFLMRCCYVGMVINAIVIMVRQDAPIAVILASVIGLIPLAIYLYIMNYNSNLNIFDLSEEIFGKYIGKFINLVFLLFTLYYSTLIFYNICDFMGSQFLNHTPMIFISFIFMIPIFYVLLKGLKTLGRVSVILLFISFFIIFLSVIGLIPKIDIDNFKPFYEYGLFENLKASLVFVAYSVLPIFMLGCISKNEIENNNKTSKTLLIFYAFLIFETITPLISTIGILSSELVILYEYPGFHVLRQVELAGFLNRLESILAMQWIFTFFVTISLNLYFILKNVKKHIKKEKKYTDVIIISILCLFVVFTNDHIYKNNTVENIFITNTLPFIFGLVLFVIPLIMAIIMFIKKKKNA